MGRGGGTGRDRFDSLLGSKRGLGIPDGDARRHAWLERVEAERGRAREELVELIAAQSRAHGLFAAAEEEARRTSHPDARAAYRKARKVLDKLNAAVATACEDVRALDAMFERGFDAQEPPDA